MTEYFRFLSFYGWFIGIELLMASLVMILFK